LGSCIGTWNELLKKKHESRAGGSALSSNTTPGIWFNTSLLASPHPSSISSPCHLSASSVVRSIGIEASSLGSALCHWFLPSGFYLRRWGLRSSAIGFYLLSLGSAPRHWALPSIIGFHPLVVGHCLLSLGSTPRRRALPSAIGLYPSSLSSAFCCWVLPLVVGPCCCGTCYASVVVHHR